MRSAKSFMLSLLGILLISLAAGWANNVSAEGIGGLGNPVYLPFVNAAVPSTPTVTPSRTPTVTQTPTPSQTPTKTRTPTATPKASPTNPPPPPALPPLPSTSYYMQAIDQSSSYALGCALGQRDLSRAGKQDSVVVLHYSYPQKLNGVFGAYTYDPKYPEFASVTDIYNSAYMFGAGYWFCVGNDFESHLYLAVGTSNYPGSKYPAVTYEHGQAWSRMVNGLQYYFKAVCARGCDGQVDVMGATDLELAWNYPTASIDWVSGFGSVADHQALVNFGALEGCPTLANPGSQCGSAGQLWSKNEILKVTSESWIRPLPEIYLTDDRHAQQWYLMSVYSYTTLGRPMSFLGVLTQYQACQQRSGCWGIDNTPQQGWNQLYQLVAGDSRTKTPLYYLSDMKWQKEKDVYLPTSRLLDAPDALQIAPSQLKMQSVIVPAAEPLEPAPLDYPSEIVEGSEGLVRPWEADIRNVWVGAYDGVYYRVLAGASAQDVRQGLVMVMRDDPLAGAFEVRTVLAPAGDGALRVVEVQDNRLVLQSASGQTRYFNLATLDFQK